MGIEAPEADGSHEVGPLAPRFVLKVRQLSNQFLQELGTLASVDQEVR
jgi:hypothetical protein